MTKVNEDCVMYDGDFMGCVSMTKTRCENCNFYITAAEYERKNGMSYEKMMELAKSYIGNFKDE